ncbi:class III chitinase ChiA1 [Aspergillus clavatus NRRL 1]|uniref:Endochitinase A1 n=1 Tax=Aspergillus clavatus (strain ATCC 1007 / CBS 513.65 / DSM 816 / NCTC 3887 / NRRL 1 / QM 1276 / 107) TaxID=344612 RepID=A1C4V8_ASPCL|nr:glycosyl hydrolase, family 18, putative [Aspergillus clavatus NRRL 1]EAW14726.1 glycosyl hydrolase, family 18, putative [Aspergillus clavatus NRRL 1]
MLSSKFSLIATAVAALASTVSAFDAASKSNVAIYYGQGSDQKRLSHFCQESSSDIINLGFINVFPDQGKAGWAGSNFGNQCDGTVYVVNGQTTQLLAGCHQLIEDIPLCQAAGKKVLLSLGGAYPATQKLLSQQSATDFADFLWGAFGPKVTTWSGPRPFGDVVVDGFDFDIEHNGDFGYATMVNHFRTRFAEFPSRRFYLSAAPQCLITDAQLGDAIAGSVFDFIWVQFYNTAACSASGSGFNFDAWVSYLQNTPNKNTKLYIGLPASASAANPGYYITPQQVQSLVSTYMARYPNNFGGVMLWEATASENNKINDRPYADIIKEVVRSCDPNPPATTTSTSTTPTPTSTTTSTTLTSSSPVSSTPVVSVTPSSSTPVPPVTSTTSTSAAASSTPAIPDTASSSVVVSSSSAVPGTPSPSSSPVGSSTPVVPGSSSSSFVASSSPVASSTPVAPGSASTGTGASSSAVATSTPVIPGASSSSPAASSAPVVPGSSSTGTGASSSAVATSTPVIPGSSSSAEAAPSSTPLITLTITVSPTPSTIPTASSSVIVPGNPSSSGGVPSGSPVRSSSASATAPASSSPVTSGQANPSSSAAVSNTSTTTTTTAAAESSSVPVSPGVPSVGSSGIPDASTGATTSQSSPAAPSGSNPTDVGSSHSQTAGPKTTTTAPAPTGTDKSSTVGSGSGSTTDAGVTPSITAVPTGTSSAVAPGSSSDVKTITTIIITSYIDICPTGFTTITTTYTTTYCPATNAATATATITNPPSGPGGSGVQTPAPTIPEGWTTTVTVCTQCAAQPTTVTLTLPVTTGTAGEGSTATHPSGVFPTGGAGGSSEEKEEVPPPAGGAASTQTQVVTVVHPTSGRPVILGTGGVRPSSTLAVKPSVKPLISSSSSSEPHVPTAPSNTQEGVSPMFTGAASRMAGMGHGVMVGAVLALSAFALM